MNASLIMEYSWTLLILIGLEGLLSADNALVLAVIAKPLPDKQKERAIDLGIYMAFLFRFIAIFLITFIASIWQIQALGAVYLIYLGGNHVYKNVIRSNENKNKENKNKATLGFWPTVLKIGISDIAFAIDSILAAVALAITLPETPLPKFGGMDSGKFTIVVLASAAGLLLIKFAANWFVILIETRPGLETTAYLIVAWVGVKLAIITLAHKNVDVLPQHFPNSSVWMFVFWSVLIALAAGGWFLSGKNKKEVRNKSNLNSKDI